MNHKRENGQPQTGRSTASNSESSNTQRSDLQIAASFSAEAKKIKQLHASVLKHVRHVVDEAIQIGGLLVKVKDKLEHGQWLPWLKANVPFSQQTASNYMKCHENRKRLKLLNVSNLTDAYLLAYPQRQRPKSHEPNEPDAQPAETEQTQPEPEPEPEPEPDENVIPFAEPEDEVETEPETQTENAAKRREQFEGDVSRAFDKLVEKLGGKKREYDVKLRLFKNWFGIYDRTKKDWATPKSVTYEDGSQFEVEQVLDERQKVKLRLQSDKTGKLRPKVSHDVTDAFGHAPKQEGSNTDEPAAT